MGLAASAAVGGDVQTFFGLGQDADRRTQRRFESEVDALADFADELHPLVDVLTLQVLQEFGRAVLQPVRKVLQQQTRRSMTVRDVLLRLSFPEDGLEESKAVAQPGVVIRDE